MFALSGVLLILAFWTSVYLVDAYLKQNVWYHSLLDWSGFSVHLGQFKWYTSRLNRFFHQLGQLCPRLMRLWFTVGVVFGTLIILPSIILLIIVAKNGLATRKEAIPQQPILTPVVPGVNLPINQLAYYLTTLLLCSIFHEIGHAVAAVREHVRVLGCGLFVVGVVPAAYIDLQTDNVQSISPLKQLRIFCAGVWHNCVLVLLAAAVIFLLPALLRPFYIQGNGVVITDLFPNTVASGPRGLQIGNEITSINDCSVSSKNTWQSCLVNSHQPSHVGYCIPEKLIKGMEEPKSVKKYRTKDGFVECCNNLTQSGLCFRFTKKGHEKEDYACLPARRVTGYIVCNTSADCQRKDQSVTCVIPSLDNSTKLLRIEQRNKHAMLFVGIPLDLLYSVSVSDYVPLWSFLSLKLPYYIETFCKYVISLSGALVVLNVIPCYSLDGRWITMALVELLLAGSVTNKDTRDLISTLIILLGTLLLGINIIIAGFTLFSR